MRDVRTDSPQVHEIRQRVSAITQKIEAACKRAGRAPEEIVLIGVTKTHPIETIQAALHAGLKVYGENRAQELKEKATCLAGQVQGGVATWHFIGSLQRNKAKEVAHYADAFHALDDLRLAETLNRLCLAQNRVLDCLVQVNISDELTKSGLEPHETLDFLAKLSDFTNLHVRGLMGIAAPAEDPNTIRPQFQSLRRLKDQALERNLLPPSAWLSMGMSDDFEVAIEEGATHIRIGSAIFGHRS